MLNKNHQKLYEAEIEAVLEKKRLMKQMQFVKYLKIIKIKVVPLKK